MASKNSEGRTPRALARRFRWSRLGFRRPRSLGAVRFGLARQVLLGQALGLSSLADEPTEFLERGMGTLPGRHVQAFESRAGRLAMAHGPRPHHAGWQGNPDRVRKTGTHRVRGPPLLFVPRGDGVFRALPWTPLLPTGHYLPLSFLYVPIMKSLMFPLWALCGHSLAGHNTPGVPMRELP